MKFTKILYLTSLILVVAFSNLKAQDNILYGMRHLPQATNNNAAFQPECNVYVGFPGISNIYLDAYNSDFTLNDATAIHPIKPDSFIIDLNRLEQVTMGLNYIKTETDLSVLNFGFSLTGGFYFTFAINNKIRETFGFHESLFEIQHGNYREDGTPIALNFYDQTMVYNEVAVGLSKKFLNGITIGGRLKYLGGVYNLNGKKINVDWYTSTETDDIYNFRFVTDIDMNSSSIVPFKELTDSSDFSQYFIPDFDNFNYNSLTPFNYLFTGNNGFAADLGIEYKLFNVATFSAGVNDLGFIKWKKNARNLTHTGTFNYDGIDAVKFVGSLNELLGMNFSALGDTIMYEFRDSIMNFVQPTLEEIPYKTNLTPRFFGGINFHVTEEIDFGLLYRGMYFNNELNSAFTVSANANYLKGWSTSVSYSILNGTYNNLGLGMAFKIGPFQWYVLTDSSAPAFFAMDDRFANKWITNSKTLNVHVGFNILVCGNKFDRALLD